MRLIGNLWNGDVPLVKAFWIYSVIISIVFIYVPPIFYFNGYLPSMPVFRGLFIAHFWISFIYIFFVLVAIWRSAMKYEGSKVWSFFAVLAISVVALTFFRKLF